MITTIKGNTIDINGTLEWLLFHRLSKKVNPVDFLLHTDSLIQFPNFLYSTSLLTMLFIETDLFIKLTIPSLLYFVGQVLVNLRFGNVLLGLMNYLLMIFTSLNQLIMLAVFITCFFFIGWWTLIIVPAYLLTIFISVTLLNSKEKKYYLSQWQKTTGSYDIFKNNAFILTYKYFADKHELPSSLMPTDEEVNNQDWLKPYRFMINNWSKIESNFSNKGKMLWRAYLNIDK